MSGEVACAIVGVGSASVSDEDDGCDGRLSLPQFSRGQVSVPQFFRLHLSGPHHSVHQGSLVDGEGFAGNSPRRPFGTLKSQQGDLSICFAQARICQINSCETNFLQASVSLSPVFPLPDPESLTLGELVCVCVCVCVCVVCVCGAVTTEMGEATVPSRMAWREGSREFEKGSGAALGPFPSPR